MRGTLRWVRRRPAAGAAWAPTDDFEHVTLDVVPVRPGDRCQPTLEPRRLDLDGRNQETADEMMVVRAGVTPPERGLAARRAQYVDRPVVGECLHRAVDTGQTDGAALGSQPRMDVLRRQERAGVVEDTEDRALRLRRHGRTCVTAYVSAVPATVSENVASDGCSACASGRMSLAPM